MNPLAIIFLGLVGLASTCSLLDGTGPWWRRHVKPADLSAEVAADWDAARNNRPCIGARDPSCKYRTTVVSMAIEERK